MLFRRKSNKRVSLAMAFLLLLGSFGGWPLFPLPVAKAAPMWPVATGRIMPFAPADSLVTTQNPPDFHWPAIDRANTTYHLQISRSDAFTTIPYERVGLPQNFYNFPKNSAFNPGTWYWRVRYNNPTDGWSEWSAVRKFRIEERNVPFLVPPVDQIMNNIIALSPAHPRIWTTADTLDDFRSLAQTTGKTVYESALTKFTQNKNNFPSEPVIRTDIPRENALQQMRDAAYSAVDMMANDAFLYLVTDDVTYAANAKRRLTDIAGWNPEGSTSYANHDQAHRYIAYKSSMVYDWLYNYGSFGDADKDKVRNMIVARTNTMMNDLTVSHPIWKNPYDSHGWTAFGYIGIIAVALLHDIGPVDPAEDWFRKVVPAYINLMPPWGGEDGGWSQGTGYWHLSSLFGKEFTDVLLSAGGFNLYDKAYSRNEGLFPLYMFPHGSPGGVFGDGSEDYPGKPSVSIYNRLAQMYGDPRLKWTAEAIGSGHGDELANYFYGDANLGVMPPVDLPEGRWFQDTGLVAMHSKLYDPDRISLFFKSSPYGSFNHSHADQNSFVVKAFGEALAVESGYFDGYFSDHDKFYGKQTFASNAITYDGKKGQPIDNIDADGRIDGFVTHPDFDATSGDATAAYMGALTQANRKIIYVRPSSFVVIDQLSTANPAGSEFEWRLHADDELNLDADQSGATILKGDAGLKVRLHSPAGLRAIYEDKFLDQNGIERKPGGAYAGEEQKHAAFITPKTTSTTIVSTMLAFKRDTVPQQAATVNGSNYMKLSFADGSIVYARMTASGEVNADNFRFDGAALAVKGNTLLLLDGKTVSKKDGPSYIPMIQSDQTATIVYGKDRLSVSSPSDTQVTIYAPGLARLREGDTGSDIPKGGTAADNMGMRGVHWTTSGNYLNVQVEKGQRAFKLNQAPMPQQMDPVDLTVEIDNVPKKITLQQHGDTEGNPVAWGKLGNGSGLYEVVEAPPGFMFASQGMRSSLYLEDNAPVLLRGTVTGALKLKSVGGNATTAAETWENPDEQRSAQPILWN